MIHIVFFQTIKQTQNFYKSKMSSSVVIVAAKRTPIGNFNGGLAAVPAHNLAATVIKDLLAGTGVQAADVSEVILGQVRELFLVIFVL